MLNNKKIFDVLTPLSKEHRITKRIATKVNDGTSDVDVTLTAEPGIWVATTNYGVVDKPTEAANSLQGLSALCLNHSNNGVNPYEANDVKVGSIALLRSPGIRVLAGEAYFELSDTQWDDLASGDVLSVNDDGKLTQVGPGHATGMVNAIVEEVDSKARTIIYVMADGLTKREV